MGIGRSLPPKRLWQKAGWNVADLDLIEANEAFAAQAIAVNRDMGWDCEKVNVNGGAIAIGHPIGASGGVFLTLYYSKCSAAGQKVWPLCVSVVAWVSRCVLRLCRQAPLSRVDHELD